MMCESVNVLSVRIFDRCSILQDAASYNDFVQEMKQSENSLKRDIQAVK